jgi:integrase
MQKPSKPRPDFPLFPAANGQWCRKFFLNGKRTPKYFGPWRDDPKGERAIKDYLARKDAILSGLDNLRAGVVSDTIAVGQLMGQYLASRRLAMVAGDLSPTTYKDYLWELQAFANIVGTGAKVSALKPEHFSAYAKHLMTERKLGRHARRRTISYVKAMLNWGAGNGSYPIPTYGNDFTVPDTRPDAMRQAKAREGKADYSRRIVTGEEVGKLMDRANHQFKAILLLGVNCGLGPADIGRLRWRHVNLDTGELNMPRGKTGTDRRGYLWKKTRQALHRVATLKHNRKARERDGQEAIVFWSRKGLPMYRETEIMEDRVEDGVKVTVSVGVKVDQAISITVGRLARELKLEGVTHYRLRHTFKTLGKKAKDKDALNLMMGHREGSTGEVYDHEDIEFPRIKKVAITVFRRLWPKAKREASKQQPKMRLVG